MELSSGAYRDVMWTRYGWGLELVTYDGDYRIRRNYVGNGSDRVTIRGSVAEFRRYIAAGGK